MRSLWVIPAFVFSMILAAVLLWQFSPCGPAMQADGRGLPHAEPLRTCIAQGVVPLFTPDVDHCDLMRLRSTLSYAMIMSPIGTSTDLRRVYIRVESPPVLDVVWQVPSYAAAPGLDLPSQVVAGDSLILQYEASTSRWILWGTTRHLEWLHPFNE